MTCLRGVTLLSYSCDDSPPPTPCALLCPEYLFKSRGNRFYFFLFFFLSVSAARWPATLDHSSVVSFILFMTTTTTTSPSPLPSSFHMFLFSPPLTPSAPHLPSPPLRYCLFEFAVSIVFPSSAASPVTEHRCNYAPIISVTHAHHTQTRRQLGRQAGKQVPERASVSGAKSTKTKHK